MKRTGTHTDESSAAVHLCRSKLGETEPFLARLMGGGGQQPPPNLCLALRLGLPLILGSVK